LCAARNPEAAEVNRLIAFYQQQLEHFRRDEKATEEITKGSLDLAVPVDGPEFAAWTMVSNVLLNMDQMLNKE
jgi:hypothetical protein